MNEQTYRDCPSQQTESLILPNQKTKENVVIAIPFAIGWLATRGIQLFGAGSLRERPKLIAWNLVITVVLGTTAWLYYQHVQSRTQPQLQVPTSSFHTALP